MPNMTNQFNFYIPQNLPQPTLYHYTSDGGLLGIISTKEIWTTNIHYLNDSEELHHAINLAKDQAQGSALLREPLLKCLNTLESANIYVFSLSEASDLLSQWRAYCPPSGGYAIGFDTAKFVPILNQHGFVLYPCIYDLEKQHDLIRQLIIETERYYEEFVVEKNTITDPIEQTVHYFKSYFQRLASILKNPHFREEREWRALSKPISPDKLGCAVRPGKHTLIPYYKVHLKSDDNIAINKIMVGPSSHPDLAVIAVGHAVCCSNISCEIENSKIPYRNW